MEIAAVIISGIMIYAMGWAIFLAFGADEHECVWWPIALIKYLLKSLYLVLFTGWRA